jgi:uncharacterized protein (TIGR02147 family)
LSEVLQGKKSLSADASLKVALRLELNETESRYFCLLAQVESEKNPTYRETLEQKLKALNPKRKTRDLSLDVFRAISDWHHLAILELTYLTAFELTPKSAAKRLGISPIEADAAIERLLRLELLKRDENDILRKSTDYVIAQSPETNSALKAFHAQTLEKAMGALKAQDPNERVSSTDVVPFDPKYIPEVRKLSDQFTSELIKISEKSKQKHQVYCLAVHFFNLTKNQKGKH